MDTLSDVLRTVRLTGAIFFQVGAVEPWVAESPTGASICHKIFPGSQHLISYHVVTRGKCWAAITGEASVELTEGDIIVFPHGSAHTLSSTPGMRTEPRLSLYESRKDALPFNVRVGEGAVTSAEIVCGFLGCDLRPFNPVIDALPAVIHVPQCGTGALGSLLEFALTESRERRMGGESVLGRVSELLFIEVVRRYLETLAPDRAGWLAGLRDENIGRAITSLHRDPGHDWNLESLANEARLSRSALVERFTQLVGQPPMQYLARWRMQIASQRLLSGMETIAVIAELAGYQSEAAFSRAFKKIVGVSPGEWRKREATLQRVSASGC